MSLRGCNRTGIVRLRRQAVGACIFPIYVPLSIWRTASWKGRAEDLAQKSLALPARLCSGQRQRGDEARSALAQKKRRDICPASCSWVGMQRILSIQQVLRQSENTALVRTLLTSPAVRTRAELVQAVCRRLKLPQPQGDWRVGTTMKALRDLESQGLWTLPKATQRSSGSGIRPGCTPQCRRRSGFRPGPRKCEGYNSLR